MATDMTGREVKVGDRIRMQGVPAQFDVVVKALVACEEGCAHGAAAIADPVTGELDEVCLKDFAVV